MTNPVPGKIITEVRTDGRAQLHKSHTIDVDDQKVLVWFAKLYFYIIYVLDFTRNILSFWQEEIFCKR